jgi:hypothetical protein
MYAASPTMTIRSYARKPKARDHGKIRAKCGAAQYSEKVG